MPEQCEERCDANGQLARQTWAQGWQTNRIALNATPPRPLFVPSLVTTPQTSQQQSECHRQWSVESFEWNGWLEPGEGGAARARGSSTHVVDHNGVELHPDIVVVRHRAREPRQDKINFSCLSNNFFNFHTRLVQGLQIRYHEKLCELNLNTGSHFVQEARSCGKIELIAGYNNSFFNNERARVRRLKC